MGFVSSMIFGHAPVIFPSVLGISIPYRPFFYVHATLLHVSLLLRAGGDLMLVESLRVWGGWLNAGAILLFLEATAASVLLGGDAQTGDASAGSRQLEVGAPPERQSEPDVTPEDVPDLELPSE